jgi:hypothetical protein
VHHDRFAEPHREHLDPDRSRGDDSAQVPERRQRQPVMARNLELSPKSTPAASPMARQASQTQASGKIVGSIQSAKRIVRANRNRAQCRRSRSVRLLHLPKTGASDPRDTRFERPISGIEPAAQVWGAGFSGLSRSRQRLVAGMHVEIDLTMATRLAALRCQLTFMTAENEPLGHCLVRHPPTVSSPPAAAEGKLTATMRLAFART